MPTKAPYARVRCPVSDFALTAPPLAQDERL